MKVKRTYGKQRTAADENSFLKKRNETFEKLFEKSVSPQQIKTKVIRKTYNQDSSLDESKIQKKVNKQKSKAKSKQKKVSVQPDSSYDEIYEAYLKDKKENQKVQKKRLESVKNVKVSTPVQLRNKGSNLLFGISPIRPDEAENLSFNGIDYPQSFYDEIRRKRMEEIEENEKQLETSATRGAIALLAKYNISNPFKSSANIPKPETSTAASAIISLQKTKPTFEHKLISAEEDVKENTDNTLKDSIDMVQSSLSIPVIEVTAPEDVVEPDSPNLSLSFVVPSLSIENELQAALVLHSSSSSVKEDSEEVNVIAARVTRRSSKVSTENYTVRASKRKSNGSILKPVASEPLKRASNRKTVARDSVEAEASIAKKVIKGPTKKSVAINLVPAIKEIAFIPHNNITRRGKSEAKNSIRLSETAERFSLNPGKWRRSLIKLRTTINPNTDPDNTRLSRRPTSILDDQRVSNPAEKLLDIIDESVLLEQSDEGSLHAALSILDSSIKCAATFNDLRKTSQRKTSVFQRSSIFYGLDLPLIDVVPSVTARQIALRRCGQQDPLPFDEVYSEHHLPNCCKIGEGVYGEVFMYKCPTTHQPIVLKIIPIEGDILVNGEPQKRFDEILQEIVISMELSSLRNGLDCATDGFVNVKRVTCVQGAYPLHLVDEWELFRDNRIEGSDNDHPEIFPYDQLYVVFELCNGGKDLEAFVFNNAEEAQSIFLQTALTLAVAERKFEFEHRDLHWGNILIAPTTDKFTEFRIDGKVVKLLTHGVKVTIIDYSLSRMVYDGAVLYDNLARDEELFQSNGDYQFDIYRLMRDRLENNFQRHDPFTNLLWLHYIVDKLINGARYRYSKTKKHRAAVNEMMQERDELLNFASASAYIASLEI